MPHSNMMGIWYYNTRVYDDDILSTFYTEEVYSIGEKQYSVSANQHVSSHDVRLHSVINVVVAIRCIVT